MGLFYSVVLKGIWILARPNRGVKGGKITSFLAEFKAIYLTAVCGVVENEDLFGGSR